MKIRHVFQRYKSDCGVACVAMITGMTYEEIFDAIGYEEGEDRFYTTHGRLSSVLRELGCEVRWKKFRAWEAVPGMAIVAVNHRYNRQNFHWVVFDGEAVYDPSPRSQYKENMQYRASGWYLLVSKEQDASR